MAKTTKVSQEQLVKLAGEVMVAVGQTEASIFAQQMATQTIVEQKLIELKNAGFTADCLQKKHPCRVEMERQLRLSYVMARSEEYVAHVKEAKAAGNEPEFCDDAWFEHRKLPVIKVPDSTRYNRFSMIKKWFEESNGKKIAKLDLYQNAARKEQVTNAGKKTSGSNAAPKQEEQGKDKPVQNRVVPEMKGVAPLQKFITAWKDENAGNNGLKEIIEAAELLARMIESKFPTSK